MKNGKRTLMRKIFSLLGKYRLPLFLSVLSALVSSALMLAVPTVIGRVIDAMVGPGQVDTDAVLSGLVLIGLLVLCAAVLEWTKNALNNRVTSSVVRDMRLRAFGHLQTLPLSRLDGQPTGDTVSRVTSDVERFSDGLLLGFTELFSGAITIVGTLIFMILLDVRIALMVVLLTPISLLVARFISTRTYKTFHEQSRIRGQETSLLCERIGNLKLVASCSAEDETQAEYERVSGTLADASLRSVFFSSLTNPTTRFVGNVIYAAVALVGALVCLGNGGAALTVGALASLLTYVGQYTKPFNEISGVITEFQGALSSADRFFEFCEFPSEPADKTDALLPKIAGNVELDDVSFSYVPEKPLIRHLSLSVPAGRHIAIVGPTGCGKTTLINLLMRFYDTTEGSVLIENVDLRNTTRAHLRAGYGMVLQDTWLSSGTIRENIAMGKPDATDEEIERAARASHAHGFISRLEMGYDTPIGEGGGTLSGGQKQLIAIARVMLAMPPMLILDEATSSIDTRTERMIQSAFDALTEGKTSFIVAHRLSTVQNADCILVMKDGAIVESGRHEELLSRGGFYAYLYESQFRKNEAI